jgi:5S rRNA maturation endonuclease (ribonuclease M5)
MDLTWDAIQPSNGTAGARLAKARNEVSAEYPLKSKERRKRGTLDCLYDYTDAEGALVFQVLRYKNPKGFSQRQPDKENPGAYINNMDGVVKPLYHLSQLNAAIASGEVVFYVEGEKDVATLEGWGLTATTNAGGAGAWKGNPQYVEGLKEARLIVLPDNDTPGHLLASEIQKELPQAIIMNLPVSAKGADVTDWAAAGGTREALLALVEAADALPAIANYIGEKDAARAVPLVKIVDVMQAALGNWPRRVGDLLFVDSGDVRWLEKVDALFSWMHLSARVCWKGSSGLDLNGASYVTPGQLFAHLSASVTSYDSVEVMPHEPAISNCYYACKHYFGVADGALLERLLEYFDNPESPHDAALIRAMFLTPAWGGLPGTRPVFVIEAPDRGYGKSALARAVAALYGGAIELEPEGNEDKIKSRILTVSARLKRIICLDNVKRPISSALIESIVTTDRVSGWRPYHGEDSRPNYLTWIVTGNGISLSRDLAARAYIIRLSRPTATPGWDDDLAQFIQDNQAGILADIVAALRTQALAHAARDRYQSWVDGVLCRCGMDPGALVAVNQKRRDMTDTDLEESTLIGEALASSVTQGAHLDDSGTFVANADAVAAVNHALAVTWNAQRLNRKIKAHIDAGRLPNVEPYRDSRGRGYIIRISSIGEST